MNIITAHKFLKMMMLNYKDLGNVSGLHNCNLIVDHQMKPINS